MSVASSYLRSILTTGNYHPVVSFGIAASHYTYLLYQANEIFGSGIVRTQMEGPLAIKVLANTQSLAAVYTVDN